MKKVILFVAALAMAMSVISCGRTSQIKDKAEYIVREAAKATASGDYYRLQEIVNEEEAYCATLTEEEINAVSTMKSNLYGVVGSKTSFDEALGKINLTVVAKDGQITASITAQNDVVKAVIESQLIQLKETLASQGLKVTDVEVTVANQGFNRSFDDNNGNAKEQKSNAHKKFRGIEELLDVDNGFEETVMDRIIESEGSSVNFRA